MTFFESPHSSCPITLWLPTLLDSLLQNSMPKKKLIKETKKVNEKNNVESRKRREERREKKEERRRGEEGRRGEKKKKKVPFFLGERRN